MVPTCDRLPTAFRLSCLAFAIGSFAIIGVLELSSPPANTARSDTAPTVTTPDEIDYDDTGEWQEIEEPAPIRAIAQTSSASSVPLPVDTFDDGRADPLAERTQVFEAWRLNNSETWNEADSAIRSCARVKFINGFVGRTPEDAIDICLDHYESEEDYE
jgi:hypothetical protein